MAGREEVDEEEIVCLFPAGLVVRANQEGCGSRLAFLELLRGARQLP